MDEPKPRNDGLNPQPHGGALMPAWTKSTNPRTGWTTAKRRAFDAMRAKTERAVERLGEMIDSEDERVAAAMVKELLDRMLGKASEAPQGESDTGGALDLSVLDHAERQEFLSHLQAINEMRDLVRARMAARDGAAAPVIEGKAG